MKSPCKKICKLDANKQRCVGCGRTLAEIRKAGLKNSPAR